ncbi:MAG TPA: hypothetical protein VNF91_09005 [Candidatus Acidoferrum sp.]|nr:hypothetical protein [Candidatus Acidoferrum sp.]
MDDEARFAPPAVGQVWQSWDVRQRPAGGTHIRVTGVGCFPNPDYIEVERVKRLAGGEWRVYSHRPFAMKGSRLRPNASGYRLVDDGPSASAGGDGGLITPETHQAVQDRLRGEIYAERTRRDAELREARELLAACDNSGCSFGTPCELAAKMSPDDTTSARPCRRCRTRAFLARRRTGEPPADPSAAPAEKGPEPEYHADGPRFFWLIERKAEPRYLGTWPRLREFIWMTDHDNALAFATREQADGAMMAIRELVPGLFPADIDAGPVEHGWFARTPAETPTLCCYAQDRNLGFHSPGCEGGPAGTPPGEGR